MYRMISRKDVPAGSFAYGQLAADQSFAVKPERWAVCTNCYRPKNEADNGASGFNTVLVAHFTFDSEADAIKCATNLRDSGEVTVVRPEPRPSTFAVGFYVLDADGNVLAGPMGGSEADEARLNAELSGLHFCSIVRRTPNGDLETIAGDGGRDLGPGIGGGNPHTLDIAHAEAAKRERGVRGFSQERLERLYDDVSRELVERRRAGAPATAVHKLTSERGIYAAELDRREREQGRG